LSLPEHALLASSGSGEPPDALSRRVHRRRQKAAVPGPDSEAAPAVAVQRRCLNCKNLFDSAWAGERICPRCKGTTAWRNGGTSSVANLGQSQSRSGRKGGS
jgi:hypothetical protein